VLSGLDPIKICVAYEVDDVPRETMPATIQELERCRPIYEEMPGWQEDLQGLRRFADLPQATRNYLKRIEELAKTPIRVVSVGPDRQETMVLANPFQ
jgi:adenylosuccinate synthase